MTHTGHRGQKIDSVRCAIVTVSDTRTPETDRSGAVVRQCLESAGHQVVGYAIVPDEPPAVRDKLLSLCGSAGPQAVVLTGGTGLAPRDSTPEAVQAVLDKHLDGFGELFRMLSFQQIGAAAMLSRALAGVCRGKLVFALPGSPDAVRLAMDRLILPELGHVVWLLTLPE